jgi:hypothetical protein
MYLDVKNVYKNLVEEPEGKMQFGKPRGSQEDNLDMSFKATECEGVVWLHLAHG